MKNILLTAVLIAFGAFVVSTAWRAQESVECYKWAEQAETYAGYYLNEWQAQQCHDNGIKVNAPVRVFFEDGSTKDFDTLRDLYTYFSK